MKIELKKVVFCAICCAVTCVLAMFAIPIGPVPITLATIGVYFSGGFLKAKLGALSQLLYLILVSLGFPFTASLKGGVLVVFGPTGGYLISYVITSAVVGIVYEFLKKMFYNKKSNLFQMTFLVFACVCATAVCYALGTVWFVAITKMEFIKAISVCVLPFLVGDLLKIIVVSILVVKLENLIKIN